MRRSMLKNGLVVIATAAFPWLGAPVPVQAQQDVGKEAPAQLKEVSNQELQAFAKAYVRYHQIRRDYEPALKKSEDPRTRDAIGREANSKINKALEASGLSAAEYNRLFTLINSDKDLRGKALELIEKRREQS